MAYTSLEIPKDTWTLVATTDLNYQVRTLGRTRIWAYEGTDIPTAIPNTSSNQPFWILSDTALDNEDYEDRIYENNSGESLWLYSEGTDTIVVKGN